MLLQGSSDRLEVIHLNCWSEDHFERMERWQGSATIPKRLSSRANQMPTLPNSMPELNQLLSALFLVALVLYLMPAVLRLGSSAERRRWFQRAATAMIGIAMAIAVVATVKWFIR